VNPFFRLVLVAAVIVSIAIALAAIFTVIPGLWPILIFAMCWYAKPLPTLDEEYATFLAEYR
jgi:hypothetical protein